MAEAKFENDAFPVRLRLTRAGDVFTGEYAPAEGDWQPLGDPVTLPDLGATIHVGLAVLSHEAGGLTEAKFTQIDLSQVPEPQ